MIPLGAVSLVLDIVCSLLCSRARMPRLRTVDDCTVDGSKAQGEVVLSEDQLDPLLGHFLLLHKFFTVTGFSLSVKVRCLRSSVPRCIFVMLFLSWARP